MSRKGDLRTILDEELLKIFRDLKEHYGLKNNSEMMRMLIKKEYDSLKKEGEI